MSLFEVHFKAFVGDRRPVPRQKLGIMTLVDAHGCNVHECGVDTHSTVTPKLTGRLSIIRIYYL